MFSRRQTQVSVTINFKWLRWNHSHIMVYGICARFLKYVAVVKILLRITVITLTESQKCHLLFYLFSFGCICISGILALVTMLRKFGHIAENVGCQSTLRYIRSNPKSKHIRLTHTNTHTQSTINNTRAKTNIAARWRQLHIIDNVMNGDTFFGN